MRSGGGDMIVSMIRSKTESLRPVAVETDAARERVDVVTREVLLEDVISITSGDGAGRWRKPEEVDGS